MRKIKIIMISICIIILCSICSYYIYNYYNAIDNLTNTQQEITIMQNELDENKNLLKSTQDELTTTRENLQIEIDKSIGLSTSLGNMSKELEIANITIAELKSEEYELIYIGDYKLTHYCAEVYEHICGTGSGLTATGTYVTPGRTVAVDPKVIPYGTEMYIEGYGWRTAEDCGGAVDGKHIDIAVDTHPQAMNMGVKSGGVWILAKKNS